MTSQTGSELNSASEGETLLEETLLKLRREIIASETEAREFGLGIPKDEHDDPPLLHALRGSSKDDTRDDQRKWISFKNRFLQEMSSARNAKEKPWRSTVANFVIEETKGMSGTNGKFIRALAEELVHLE